VIDNSINSNAPSSPLLNLVTVVVPTRNASGTLESCLKSLRAQTMSCRVVVVDNGSTDDTAVIAERWADVVLHSGPERSAQRNYGARAYPAAVVGFIDADMILAPTVVEEAFSAISDGMGSVIVPERTVGNGFWVEVRAFERSFYNGSDAIEAARFFRWDIFEQTGGFDEELTGAEDWDLTISARQLAPVGRITALIEHDEGAIGYLAACRKKAYYAEGVRRYTVKRGISALRQAGERPWLRNPQLLLNPRGVGLVALKAGEATAVVLAIGSASVGRTVGHFEMHIKDRRQRAGRPYSSRIHRLLHCATLSIRIFQTMQNGGSLLVRMAIGVLAPGRAGEVVFHSRNGMQLVAPSRDYAWWRIVGVMIDDCYHLSELAAELRDRECVVLDIGAHVGSFTVSLAAAVPKSRCFAFEASAERVGYLCRNIALNELDGRVVVVRSSLGNQPDRRTLIDMKGEVELPETAEPDRELVDVANLSDLMDSLESPIELLKVDCESCEYEIVASASIETLRRIKRFVIEYRPTSTQRIAVMFSALAEAGLVERWRYDALDGQLVVVYLGREVD